MPTSTTEVCRLMGLDQDKLIRKIRRLGLRNCSRALSRGGKRDLSKGIGSDASYNPANGGYGAGNSAGLNVDEFSGQLGQIGQKSMRILSDSFATLQTGVKASAPHPADIQRLFRGFRLYFG